MPNKNPPPCDFVTGFRHSAPYIHAHRGRTFVIGFSGEAVADANFAGLIHDFALLHSLGIRLVLVHGARPQVEQRLKERGAEIRYANGLRITDDAALACVKEAVGTIRVDLEALLSMGLANTPMSGARIGVASGNFVTAQPLGVREGVDYCHTGQVRRIDGGAIRQQLDDQRIVLLSPLGYSPTGEIFNVSAEEVAMHAAIELRADKLILLHDGGGNRSQTVAALRVISPQSAMHTVTLAAQGSDAKHADEWNRTEASALEHLVHTLDIIGLGFTPATVGADPAHATVVMNNQIVDLLAIRGVSHESCIEHSKKHYLHSPRRHALLISRDRDNNPWRQRFGSFLQPERPQLNQERNITDPSSGSLHLGYRELLDIFQQSVTVADVQGAVSAQLAA